MKKKIIELIFIVIVLFVGILTVDGAKEDSDYLKNTNGTKSICYFTTKSSCDANSSCVWFEELGYGCLKSEVSEKNYSCIYSGLVEGLNSQEFRILTKFHDGTLTYALASNWYKYDPKTNKAEWFIFSQEPLLPNDPNTTTLKEKNGKEYFTCPDSAWIKTGSLFSSLSDDKNKYYNSQIYFTRPDNLSGYKQVSLVKDPNYNYNGIMSITVNTKCYQCNGQSNLYHWGISPNGNFSSCSSGWHEVDLSKTECQRLSSSVEPPTEEKKVDFVECKYNIMDSSLAFKEAPYRLRIYCNSYEVYDVYDKGIIKNQYGKILNWDSNYEMSYYNTSSKNNEIFTVGEYATCSFKLNSSSVCPTYLAFDNHSAGDDMLVHNDYNVLYKYASISGRSLDYIFSSLASENVKYCEEEECNNRVCDDKFYCDPENSSTNPGENVYGCEVIPDEIREWIKDSLNLVKYIALVLVIVLGVLDFIKAAASGEADQMKKSGNSFLKRIIAVVILFLLPLIVELILNLIEIFGADSTCLPK